MFILEGNIGAGKSTFIRILKEFAPFIDTAFEPLAQWDGQGASLLENFMNDPKRWAYTMETFVMSCRFRDHLRLQAMSAMTLAERSLYSGHYVFAVNSRAQGFMTEAEWGAYETLFNYLVLRYCSAPKGFIYLRVDPEVAYGRACKRQRAAESSLSLEYLKQIHERHERFMVDHEVHEELKKVPVLVLDGHGDFENDRACAVELAQRVVEFMRDQASSLGGISVHDRVEVCI
ncbi:TPA: hypothetical protein DDZ86_02050 [Candidatus Dependentiae bacterium]|nr:MAG: hypothetical protein UW09_C0001G0229 [candidate division TM6 bacterium GW2011_GWF2_43_87]HBL98406.1 hypothetical protein [Candidatus Dependentiae bacterium]